VTKADADLPALIPHLNIRIHLGIRLSVPWVEGMPFAQVLHRLTETRKKPAPAEARPNDLLLLTELYTVHRQAKTILGSQFRLASNGAHGILNRLVNL
jgi:hypothetical protein